jgi:hypothetical protein
MEKGRVQLARTAGAVRELGEAKHRPIIRDVPERPLDDAAIDAALEALTDSTRLRAAESRVARVAPQLQRILNQALAEGGWFGEAHEAQLLKAATEPDQDARLRLLRTLVAEETRMGMMIGVAVGWELARELDPHQQED